MVQTSHSTGAGARIYALLSTGRSSLHAAAQRATQKLARHDPKTLDLSDVARWEGEGGAARPRITQYKAAPARLGRGKPAPAFPGERNTGPPLRARWAHKATARPMNTHRGARSR